MKKTTLAALTVLLFGSFAMAQSAAEKAVMRPVEAVFKGMKLGDSALVHSAFTKDVMFISIGKNKAGKPAMRNESLDDFLKAVGTPHKEQWNELIWNTEIRIDGNFAQVYAKFGFFLGKKFSHCGIDAFHLFLGDDGQWKIFNLSDTRQTDGCNVPDEVTRGL